MRLKTVPIMDELSSVVFLNHMHSSLVLGLGEEKEKGKGNLKVNREGKDMDRRGRISQVLVTAGQRGLLRIYHVEMEGERSLFPPPTPLPPLRRTMYDF